MIPPSPHMLWDLLWAGPPEPPAPCPCWGRAQSHLGALGAGEEQSLLIPYPEGSLELGKRIRESFQAATGFWAAQIIPAELRPSRHTQLLLCTCFLAGVGSSHLFLRRLTSSRLSSATGVGVNRTCQPCFWGFSSNSSVTHGSLIPLALRAQYGFETYFQDWNLENTPWTRSCKPVNPLLAPLPFPGNISPYGATVPMCITASHLPRKHHLAPSAALQWIIIYIITYLCIYFPRWPLLMVCCT